MKDVTEEYDPAEKWIWNYKSLSDVELKSIAKDMYNNVIFSNLFVSKNEQHLLTSIFMPLAFLGPGMHGDDVREKNIDSLLEEEYYQKYVSNIGMLYEFMKEASPRGINGYPMFPSMKLLDKKDTEKVIEFYNKYSELQKKLESEF